MEVEESKTIQKEEPVKRILCIGKIHKGKKTLVIAFPRPEGNAHGTIENPEA